MTFLRDLKARYLPDIETGNVDASRHSLPLDGVRGLAILLVLCYDCLKIPNTGDPATMLVRKLAASGWTGVDLFFVLSGFLITGILLDTRGRKGYWKSFILRRSVRIFPLYYATLIAVFFAIPAAFHFKLIQSPVVPNNLQNDQWWYWLYGQNWLFATRQAWPAERILNHFWSLAVEEQFYLIWPLVVAWFGRKSLSRLCLSLCTLAVVLRVALLMNGVAGVSTYVMTITRMDSLCMGALLALAIRDATWLKRWGKWMMTIFCVAVSALVVIDAVWPVLKSQSFAAYSLGHTLIGLTFASLIGAVILVPERHLLARVFSVKPLLALGKYSYAIYVFHRFVYAAVLKCDWTSFSESSRGWLVFVCTLLGSVLVAKVSWILLEQPCLKLKKHFPRPDETDSPASAESTSETVPTEIPSAPAVDPMEFEYTENDRRSYHKREFHAAE